MTDPLKGLCERLEAIVGDQHLLPGHPVRDAAAAIRALSSRVAKVDGVADAIARLRNKDHVVPSVEVARLVDQRDLDAVLDALSATTRGGG